MANFFLKGPCLASSLALADRWHLSTRQIQPALFFCFEPSAIMVFEGGPLEADAVDESSPPLLLRPIMWMLGGSGGTSSPDGEENIASDTKTSDDDDDDDAIPGPCSTDADEDENDDDDDYLVKNRSPPRFMSQSSPPPGVIRASDGEIDGSSSDEESPALSSANAGGGIPVTVAEMAALSLSESTQGVVNASPSPKSRSAGSLNSRSTQRLRPSSRKLSWSDRAGGDLATYSAYDVSIFSAAIISRQAMAITWDSKISLGSLFWSPLAVDLEPCFTSSHRSAIVLSSLKLIKIHYRWEMRAGRVKN